MLVTNVELYGEENIETNLLETFYIVTNSVTLSLDSDPQAIKIFMENF